MNYYNGFLNYWVDPDSRISGNPIVKKPKSKKDSGMDLVSSGNKPFHEPMLTQIYVYIRGHRPRVNAVLCIPRIKNTEISYVLCDGIAIGRYTLTHWGRDTMDAIPQTTFSSAFSWRKMFEFRLKFVPKGAINNIPALVQIMAWRRSGDKPLSEPIMVGSPALICVTRPRWVNVSTTTLRLLGISVTSICNNRWWNYNNTYHRRVRI